ncbi:ABC transporter permease [Propioniciclava sinopodophylli]|uniref:ABC transporter permease n=1 Tax=Propioniciclava sinopodophylli TaxID=1837344 RepID=UPI0024924C62|nr:FtsX-like permease family protein [Propioniciclava sinopodophylli]
MTRRTRTPWATSIDLAWRYLRGRGLRSALTTLAVALGVMLVFGLNGISPALMEAFTKSMMSAAGRIDVTVGSAFRQPIEVDVLDTVLRTPGIAAASGEVQRPAPLTSRAGLSDAPAMINVVGIDPGPAARVRDLPVEQGRALASGDGDVAVLSSDLAERLAVRVGDELTLPSASGTTRLTIVGLLSTPTVPGQEQLYVPLASAQRLFSLGDRLTVVEASLAPGANRATVEDALRRQLGDRYTVGGLSSNASLVASMEVAQYAFTLFGVFALATAGFIIANSFRTVIAERRRDIGMLRAIGTPRRVIRRMFLAESLLQGVLGTALGLVLGWLLAAGAFAAMRPIVAQYMRMQIGPPVFEPWTWALAIGLGLLVTVLAAVLPARTASRIAPLEAMRPPVAEVHQAVAGRRALVGAALVMVSVFLLASRVPTWMAVGSVVFLVAIALVTPAVVNPLASAFGSVVELLFAREGALARSNLQRNPARSAATVTAVMLGLASIVAMLTVVASIFSGFMGYIDRSMGSDYLVIPGSIVLQEGNVAAGPRLGDELRAVPGVASVASLRVANGRLDGHDVQVIGIDPVEYPRVASLEWNGSSSDAAFGQLAQGRWLIANGIFASQAGLRTGQAVTLETPNGRRTYVVAAVGSDYLNAKLSTIYVSQDVLARDFATTTDLMFLLNLAPGADASAADRAVAKVVDDYPAFTLHSTQEWRAEQQATFNGTLGIFYGLIAVLALPSLLALMNTLAISVLARTREIGMLRAVGATRRQIRRMVMAESILLTLIGIAFGVVSGLWLGYALVVAMSNVGWEMPWSFPFDGVVVTIAVGLVFGVLASVAPARSAARLDVVDALHHE